MRMSACAKRRNRSGAVAVEFALLLPLLMLLAVAAGDFGRIVHHYIALSNSVRVGAEYGSRHGFTPFTRDSWESQVHQVVLEEAADTPTFDVNQLTVEVQTTIDGDDLNQISVKASMPFKKVIAWPGMPEIVLLSHQVTMRQCR